MEDGIETTYKHIKYKHMFTVLENSTNNADPTWPWSQAPQKNKKNTYTIYTQTHLWIRKA